MTDKSQTHVKYSKNGQEGWLHKNTVEDIGKAKLESEGYNFEPSVPPEVTVVKQNLGKGLKNTDPKVEVIKHASPEGDSQEGNSPEAKVATEENPATSASKPGPKPGRPSKN